MQERLGAGANCRGNLLTFQQPGRRDRVGAREGDAREGDVREAHTRKGDLPFQIPPSMNGLLGPSPSSTQHTESLSQ